MKQFLLLSSLILGGAHCLAPETGRLSRRQAFAASAFGLSTCLVANAPSAQAAEAVGLTPNEIERIQLGYKQITYLLDNFEKETTVCKPECKRDADAIRRALGVRSTTDPLFQIEKVFSKVKNMDLDMDKLEAFFEASEDWNSAINMSNSMAFISQFGEYNPGGGKDEVLKYLLESQKQLVLSQKALATIMDSLGIEQS
jgi:hypothetical protein